MHTNQTLRTNLLREVDGAFVGLMGQVDHLFDLVTFYIDRYPMMSRADQMRTGELSVSVDRLGLLSSDLAQVITRWKLDIPVALPKLDVELDILNEIYTDMQALVLFIIHTGKMDIEPFDMALADRHFHTLVRANRLLT